MNLHDLYLNIKQDADEEIRELAVLLKEFRQLQQVGLERSLWNQDYIQKQDDEKLIDSTLKCMSEIEDARNKLVTCWKKYKYIHTTNHPYLCPSHLQDRYKNHFNKLLIMSKEQNIQICNEIKLPPIKNIEFTNLKNQCKELDNLICQKDKYESDAKEKATKWAEPGSIYWKKIYNEVRNKYRDDLHQRWSNISNIISNIIENMSLDREEHYSEYISNLLSEVPDIKSHVEKTISILASSHIHIRELKRTLLNETKKDKESIDALNAPWEAVQWKTMKYLEDNAKHNKPILTENDHILISRWCESKEDFAIKEKMSSARKAELFALKLYSELYGDAEDLSILQITSKEKDDRWSYADIETNELSIDVKNARRSFLSPESYSEHCVPCFKLNRRKHDVYISSFLSPYNDDSQPIIWLGETTLDEIKKLQNEFTSKDPSRNVYLRVDFKTHSDDKYNYNKNKYFLPAWLFDYPPVCYENREEALRVIRSAEFIFPRQETWIGNAILANRDISVRTDDALCQEVELLQARINKCGLNRAVLFLHILDRFCVSSKDKTFKNTKIDKILFPEHINNKKIPLGVYDPLETIWNLWNLLVDVSEKCLQETRKFSRFKLSNPNILQGDVGDDNWITIYAYCGGCGKNPIYLGQDGTSTCQTCKYLICPKCKFCSKQCSG